MTQCTFEILHEDHELMTSSFCGRKVTTILEKDGIKYPRCSMHSSDKRKSIAEDLGYTITKVDP